jgi:hypothetical protein
VRAWYSQLATFIFPALLSSCAAPSSYMGIGFAPGAASPELQALAQRARAGDKQAQLDLGIAFEEGRGVGVDLLRARKLYAQAAATTGGTTYIYAPASKKGGRGSVTPINLGPRAEGLQEAKERLHVMTTGIGHAKKVSESKIIFRLAFALESRFKPCLVAVSEPKVELQNVERAVESLHRTLNRRRHQVRDCIFEENHLGKDIEGLSISLNQQKLITLFRNEYFAHQACKSQMCRSEILKRLQQHQHLQQIDSLLSYAVADSLSYVRTHDLGYESTWWWPERGICGDLKPHTYPTKNSLEVFICTVLGVNRGG